MFLITSRLTDRNSKGEFKMMYEVEFTNVDNVIRDLVEIDEDRNYGEFCLADVVEWLKNEVDRDIVGGITYEDLILEIKFDIEDGNLKFDNTYNWSGNVTHELCFAYKRYEDMLYVVMMIHRFGDVRCNYTDYIVLEYDDEYQFYDSWYSVSNTAREIEIENVDSVYLSVNPFSEYVDVYCELKNGETMDFTLAEGWVESLEEEIRITVNEHLA